MQRRTKQRTAFVYMIIVDDMIRYVGKGRGERHLTHAINARRDAARRGCKLSRLSPLMHRNLVKAIRAGSQIRELIIASGLSDAEAYRTETQIIADFHRRLTGQLWNTIDERCMDKRLLPPTWDNPAHPLYRLPRPLVRSEGGVAVRSKQGQKSQVAALEAMPFKRTIPDLLVGLTSEASSACPLMLPSERRDSSS